MDGMPALRRLGADLLIRVTSGICDRSRWNAELAGALFEARRHDWSEALALYDPYDATGRRPAA
jgi:hypothetical protein